MQVCYRHGPSLTLDKAIWLGGDFLGSSAQDGSRNVRLSPRWPHADDGSLHDDGDWELGDLFSTGAPDPHLAFKTDSDRLSVACERAGVMKPATMTNVVAVAEARLKSLQELPQSVALVKSKAEKLVALTAQSTSLQGIIAESESSLAPLHDELGSRQTQVPDLQASMTSYANAGTSPGCHLQELDGSTLLMESNLRALHAERRTLKAKEWELIEPRTGFEGQVIVLSAELSAAQPEVKDLALQCDGARVRMETLTAEQDGAVTRQDAAIRNM